MRIRRLAASALLLGIATAGAALGAGDEPLRQRAERGDAQAQFELGQRYLLGRGGTERDPVEAAKWFQRSAAQGDRRAQMNLSTAYAEGRGVEQDEVAAVEWLLKAAEQGHPRAMVVLGERFLEGRGVSRSPVLGYLWVSRAASAGSPLAQARKPAVALRLSPEQQAAAEWLEQVERERARRLKMNRARGAPSEPLPEGARGD